VRTLVVLSALCLLSHAANAQAAVASDLWRVADGTQVVPLALADGGTAPLWTPAVALGDAERVRVGIEAINSPTEIGVSGGLVALTIRAGRLGFASLTYGRLGVADVAFTETSPEAIGNVLIYSQTASLGFSRRIAPGITGGVAVRYLSGELGPASRSQLGFDVGARYASAHIALGAATRFFDPTLRAAVGAASYNLGASWSSSAFDAWGTRASVIVRYGVTAARGESAQHLATAGVSLGGTLALDAGVSGESASGDAVWRSRLGVSIGSGPFRIQIARDGGVNGFGATYRFGLTAAFK
jgi:hypothetical protein